VFGFQLIFTDLEKRLIWFIGCITVYYLIYPLIIMKTQNNKSIIFRSLTVFLLLLVARTTVGIFNANIFAYFPVFVLGILVSNNQFLLQKNLLKIKNISIIVVAICFYWFIITRPPMLHDNLHQNRADFINTLSVHIPKVIFGVALLFVFYWLANRYITKPNIRNIVVKCSVASYPAYLFHEFIYYHIIKLILTSLDVENIFNSYVVVFLGIPLVLVICYYIQITYNKIISSLFSGRSISAMKHYSSDMVQVKYLEVEDTRKNN